MKTSKRNETKYSYIIYSDSASTKSGTDKSKAPMKDTRPQTEVHGIMIL